MQKTLSERIVSALLAFGKRHKNTKHLMLSCIFVVISLRVLFRWVRSNTKKLSLAGFIMAFFFTCSSFNFPQAKENVAVDVSEYMEESVISLESSGHIMLLGEEVAKSDFESIMGEAEQNSTSDSESTIGGTEQNHTSDFELYTNEEHGSQEVNEDGEQYTLDDIMDSMELDHYDGVSVVSYAESGTTFSKDDWNLILVNKQHPVPDGVEPELCNIAGDKKCDERIVGELLAMMQDAKEDGVSLLICSAYRSYDYQVTLFQRKILKYMGRGYSYVDAYQISSQAVTLPGYSEHQLGLSFDIVQPSYVKLNAGFADTAAGKWLKENAYKYGFILRYPEGKEFITGIEFEPWHYRYVGVEAATIIMENELTLEEFIEHIEDYTCTEY